MNELKKITESYEKRYSDLKETMASVEVIVSQLTAEEYASLSTYLNNMELIASAYQLAGDYLDADFQKWLKHTDLNLFISIMSIGRAITLMRNLIHNLQLTLKRS